MVLSHLAFIALAWLDNNAADAASSFVLLYTSFRYCFQVNDELASLATLRAAVWPNRVVTCINFINGEHGDRWMKLTARTQVVYFGI